MARIAVPKPPASAYNPDRPVSGLLKAQAEHMSAAAHSLPLKFRARIDRYHKAIRTEGEAAEYVRQVTEAIHAASRQTVRDEAAAT